MIKILVIDDQKISLVTLTALFYKAFPDARIITALSGKEGIEKARAENPDIILVDLVMPIMDGFETCKKLKEDVFLRRIPVIIITATEVDTAIRIRGLESGAEAFLSKPIDEMELTAQVSSMIRLKKSEDHVRQENIHLEEMIHQRTKALESELEERKKIEEALRESEERYRALFDRSLNCVYIHDFEGRFIDANETALNLLGYKKEEIRDLTFTSLISEDQLPLALKATQEILETGCQKGVTEFRLQLRNGNYVYVETQGSAILSNGTYTAIQSVARNITSRKHTEANLMLKTTLLETQSETSIDGILAVDNQGKVILSNKQFSEMWRIPPHLMEKKDDKELLKYVLNQLKNPEEFNRKVAYLYVHPDEKTRDEVELVDGRCFDRYSSSMITADGTDLGRIWFFRDITERKQAEKLLKEACVKAEAGNLLKTAFMNNISHEVRTPLNGILGFSNLIIQPETTDDEKVQYYSLVKASSNRLLSTINNYMDISLIASGNMEMKCKSFDLHPVLHQLCEDFQPLCTIKNLELHLQIPGKAKPIKLLADAELFGKALSHLLDNAVKFTKKGKITFGYSEQPGALEFFVKDTGTGIRKEAQSRIFESFMQEELSHIRGYEGSGLGLSIAQGIIQLLNGDMRLKSEKGVGSTFSFTIPYEGAKEEVSKPESVIAEVPVHGNPVILVAEDDESNLFYLETILEKTGVGFIPVMNGKEAVAQCRKHPEISLVLMDLKMPVMDGFEAAREIKSFRNTLTIIALTAFAMRGDEMKALEAGCDDYLAKPVDKNSLMNVLGKYGLVNIVRK